MELCDDGLTLDHRINAMVTNGERMAAVHQLFQGIQYLHGLKIVHRDLKPANILFKGDVLKICDMGQSRLLLMDVRHPLRHHSCHVMSVGLTKLW